MDILGKIRISRIRKETPLTVRYPSFSIGRGTYGTPQIIGDGVLATLSIGAFCSIAPDVSILLDVEHRLDWITTFPFNVLWNGFDQIKGHPSTNGDVTIGHDVWIGLGATILSGVTVATGAVIGCKSVVSKNVPPYSIVAGNPARVIGSRFSPEIVARLLASEWWNLPDSEITSLVPLLLSARVEDFLQEVERRRC